VSRAQRFPTLVRLLPGRRRATRSQQVALLRLIAIGSELHLPLQPLLESWANDERGPQQDRVRRLARLIGDGVPLSAAVEEVRGALRDEDVLAIRFGAQSGTLADSLRASLDREAVQPADERRSLRDTLVYAVVVGMLFCAISTFYFVKIAPALRAILHDFNMGEPAALQLALSLAQTVERYWWVIAIAILVGWRYLRPGRRPVAPWNAWRQDSLGGRASAEILRKLSIAADAGRPMAGALSTLARYHFDPPTRHRLLYARNEVEQGADVWPSMVSAGLMTRQDANVLDAAERLGNRAWALRHLAAVKDRAAQRWVQVAAAFGMPAVVLLLGAFVLLLGLSMFVPLLRIVEGML
jgi:type IV pilus assembly protein PilC